MKAITSETIQKFIQNFDTTEDPALVAEKLLMLIKALNERMDAIESHMRPPKPQHPGFNHPGPRKPYL